MVLGQAGGLIIKVPYVTTLTCKIPELHNFLWRRQRCGGPAGPGQSDLLFYLGVPSVTK